MPARRVAGLPQIIPTEEKVKYLTRLVSLGFSHIDAVSFVSPKHVPQMADSEAVMQQLSQVKLPSGEAPEIIGIVVNEQGLERALADAGRDHDRLSVFHLGLFSPRQREYVARRIARSCRKAPAPDQSRRPKARRLYFDGVWQSLRRALGSRKSWKTRWSG